MFVISIAAIRNEASQPVIVRNQETPSDTEGWRGEFAPGAVRDMGVLGMWIPWCTSESDFAAHHISVALGSRRYAIWQASYDFVDRVRMSTDGRWHRPGAEINGVAIIESPFNQRQGARQRTLIVNDSGVFLLPQEIFVLAGVARAQADASGYSFDAHQEPEHRRTIASTPKRTATAFSMAGHAADAHLRGETRAPFMYRDSGKRYAFRIRDGIHIQDATGTQVRNGVVFIEHPLNAYVEGNLIRNGSASSPLRAGVSPFTTAISFEAKRAGVAVPLPEFDLVAASGGRVFAKEKGRDRFYFALVDELFVQRDERGAFAVPGTYFKLDPEFARPDKRPADLLAHLGGDYARHPSGERFTLFRLMADLQVWDGMPVRQQRGVWHLLETRPPVPVDVSQEVRDWFGIDLDNVLPGWVNGMDRYRPVTHRWANAQPPRPPVSPECMDYAHVVDIGVSHVHHYDQYESVTGGELQAMRTRAFLTPEIARARLVALGLHKLPLIGQALELLTPYVPRVTYADGYALFNGPVRDGDGFIDGMCNYYALVKLRSGDFTLLFQDEQSFFSQRWRIAHPDDYRGLLFALVADLAWDVKRAPLEKLYDWEPARFWCPFRAKLVNDNSRLAVAGQVVLVTGGTAAHTASAEIYSANFSWSSMDRTWRWRALPKPARYFADEASKRDEVMPPVADECVFPETIRLREDMTLSMKGTRLGPGGLEKGRWYQRYLPCTTAMPPPLHGGVRPQPYTHPWKFLSDAMFDAADQYSHFGVYDSVDSRTQYYVVDFDPASGTEATLQAGAANPEPWIDDTEQLSISAAKMPWDTLRIPWEQDQRLVPITVSWPPFPIERRHPSMYNRDTRLRIVKRGTRWIAMHWDKRDDDLMPFDQSTVGTAVRLRKGSATAVVRLQSNTLVEKPPAVPRACFWWQPNVTPARAGIGFFFPPNPGGQTAAVAQAMWRVRMAAPNAGQPAVSLFDQTFPSFARSAEGFYEYQWTLPPDQEHWLRERCSAENAVRYGTSIWFEDLVGHVAVPDSIVWGRSPAVSTSATPSSIPLERATEVTVTARDSRTQQALDGDVKVNGVVVGRTGQRFTHTFRLTVPPRRGESVNARDGEPTDPTELPEPVPPVVTVSVPDYPDAVVDVEFFVYFSRAVFVRQSLPSPMVTGRAYGASVTMRNAGTSTWTSGGANPFRLGSQSPRDGSTWGFSRRELPAPVAPGAEVTFAFDVIAPAPGMHAFQWQMLQELVEWFGDPTPVLNVQVTTPPLPILTVGVTPYPPPVNRLVSVVVRAVDSQTGASVAGRVLVNNVNVGPTNAPFSTTFRTRRVGVPPDDIQTVYPIAVVTAAGYQDAELDLGFPDIL